MKLRDTAQKIVIESAKLTKYALNENHPKGKNKARVFAAALGYTEGNYLPLLQQLEEQAPDGEVTLQKKDRFGDHVQLDLEIIGIEGQKAIVRTG